MAEKKTTEPTTEASAEASAEATAAATAAATAPTAGLVSYIVQHRLLHDNHEYAKGDLFQCADEAVVATLRKAKAIALRTEVESADAVAQRMADLEAQIAAMQAQNARLTTAREQSVK